jgi:hypothetical protein
MQHAVIENNFSMVFSSDEGCHCFVKGQTHACPGKEDRNRKLLDSMPRRLEEVIARQSASN